VGIGHLDRKAPAEQSAETRRHLLIRARNWPLARISPLL
jgi:hypothetical protein